LLRPIGEAGNTTRDGGCLGHTWWSSLLGYNRE
jgi:hypothetical protein